MTMLKHQLHIQIATSADMATVANILATAATRFKWIDNTEDSRVENTIKSFADRKFYGDGMGARQVGRLIILDFNQRTKNADRIDAIFQMIAARIRSAFTDRLAQPEKDHFVPAHSTLPLTAEMKARAIDSRKRKQTS